MTAKKVSEARVVIDCIRAARPPSAGEMERLATRVCREIRPGAPDWSEVAVGSETYRRTMCIARAAVGFGHRERPDAPVQPR